MDGALSSLKAEDSVIKNLVQRIHQNRILLKKNSLKTIVRTSQHVGKNPKKNPRLSGKSIIPIRKTVFKAKNRKTQREKAGQSSNARMVLIDGSNVAYAYTCHQGFAVTGIEIVLEFFRKINIEAMAVVPEFRAEDHQPGGRRLTELRCQGYVILTPCKNLPGRRASSYDDRMMLQMASEHDAGIVTNDNFRDLVHESSVFRDIIENRVFGYTFCKDLFIVPKDPYGEYGPSLRSILYRS